MSSLLSSKSFIVDSAFFGSCILLYIDKEFHTSMQITFHVLVLPFSFKCRKLRYIEQLKKKFLSKFALRMFCGLAIQPLELQDSRIFQNSNCLLIIKR